MKRRRRYVLSIVRPAAAMTLVFGAGAAGADASMQQRMHTASPAPKVDLATSSVTASPSVVLIDSRGGTLTVTLKDAAGGPVEGKLVQISTLSPSLAVRVAGIGRNAVAAGSAFSDNTGVATFNVTNSLSGSTGWAHLNVRDTTDHLNVGRVWMDFAAAHEPDVANSSVVASPASVPADDVTTVTVTVIVVSFGGQPVSGKDIELKPERPFVTTLPVGAQVTTDQNGVATFSFAARFASSRYFDALVAGTVAGGSHPAFARPTSGSSGSGTKPVFTQIGRALVTFVTPGSSTTTTTTTAGAALTLAQYRSRAGTVCTGEIAQASPLKLTQKASWRALLKIYETTYGKLLLLTPPALVAPLVTKVLAELRSLIDDESTILAPANLSAHTVSQIIAEIATAGAAIQTRYGGTTTKTLWMQIGVPKCGGM